MANLLSWLGNAARRVENTFNNDVIQPINRDVVQPVQRTFANPGSRPGPQQTPQQSIGPAPVQAPQVHSPSIANILGYSLQGAGHNLANFGEGIAQGIGSATGLSDIASNLSYVHSLQKLTQNPNINPNTKQDLANEIRKATLNVGTAVPRALGRDALYPVQAAERLGGSSYAQVTGKTPSLPTVGKTPSFSQQVHEGGYGALANPLMDLLAVAGTAKGVVDKAPQLVDVAKEGYASHPILSTEAGSVPLGPKPKPEQLANQKALEYAKDPNSFDAKGNFKTSIQNELTNILNGKTPSKAPAAPTPVAKNYRPQIPTTPTQPVNGVVAKLGSKTTVLDKIGTQSSQLAARKIRAIDNLTGDLRAGYRNSSRTVLGLSDAEMNSLGNSIEHGAEPINAKVAQALTEAKATLPKALNDYTATGGKTGNIENYFPRDYSGLKKGSPTYNQALQSLLDKGQAKTTAEAVSILDRLKSGDTTKPGFFGSFDRSRYDVPGYQYTKAAYEKYLNGAAQKTAESTHFGPKGEIAKQLVGKIAREGGDANLANQAISNYLHDASAGKTDYLAPVRGVTGAARLGKAAVSHLGQSTNIPQVTRLQDLPVAIGKSLTKEGRDYITESDVNNPANVHGLTTQETSVKGALGKVTAAGLTPVMKVNRGLAALAGREYGGYLAKTGDVAKLRDLGVTGDIGETLTHDQELQASRGVANQTMFSPSRASTPIGAETPTGKTIGQYRTAFSYKQTGLIWNNVIKEAANGNLKPLGKFLALSAPVAAGTVLAKNAISGRQEGPGGVAIDTAAALGGIPGELAVQGARYAKGNILKTVAGAVAPVAGEAVDLGQRVQKALNKNPDYKPLERYGLGLTPVVGGRLSNAVVPNTPSGTVSSGNKSLDQSIQDLKNAKNQPGGKWEDSLSKQDATIAKLNGAQQQALVDQGKISQGDVTRANKLKATAEQLLKPPKQVDSNGINASDVKFVQSYDRLTTQGKDAFKADAGNDYRMGQIKYNQDKANGKLSRADDINRTENLAKLKVNAMKDNNGYLFSKDIITGYGLSKAEVADILAAPGGQDFANKLVAYGDALVKAGAVAKNKWRDSKGGISMSSGSKGGSGGRGRKASIITTGFKTASKVKAPSIPKISVRAPKAFKAPSVRKLSVSKIPTSSVNRKRG